MPFKSEKQKKFMFANHPEIAKKWMKEGKGYVQKKHKEGEHKMSGGHIMKKHKKDYNFKKAEKKLGVIY